MKLSAEKVREIIQKEIDSLKERSQKSPMNEAVMVDLAPIVPPREKESDESKWMRIAGITETSARDSGDTGDTGGVSSDGLTWPTEREVRTAINLDIRNFAGQNIVEKWVSISPVSNLLDATGLHMTILMVDFSCTLEPMEEYTLEEGRDVLESLLLR